MVNYLSTMVCFVLFVLLVLSARRNRRLNVQNTKLHGLATFDSLTGAMSRGAVLDLGRQELLRGQRHHRPISILMMDLDNFKNINDLQGHGGGDQVLIEFVNLATSALRDHDTLGRVGGEEFILILPETGLSEAIIVAERIRYLTERAGHCTVSIGATITMPFDSLEAMIARADRALYASKKAGRNRVTVAEEHLTIF